MVVTLRAVPDVSSARPASDAARLLQDALRHQGAEQAHRRLSVILPLIAATTPSAEPLDAYPAALRALPNPAELVIVHDGPPPAVPDGGPAEVRLVASGGPGWGRAVRAGLADARGDLLAYANPRRTSAETVVAMLAWSLIYPSAVLRANRRSREGLVQRLGSLLFNVECRLALGISAWDVNGTPKVLPADAVGRLRLTRDGDLLDVELALACQREGLTVLEIPVHARSTAGSARTPLGSALRLFAGVLALRREATR